MIELPRYKLRVGDWLRYGLTDASREGEPADRAGGRSSFAIEWEFHVTARQAEGRWRLVFSERRRQTHESAADDGSATVLHQDGFFEISDDGQLQENWSITPLANPAVVFPRLPADPAEMAKGWRSTRKLDGARSHYLPAERDEARKGIIWQFVEDCQTELDPIYEAWRERRYAFDLERGLVTHVAAAFERGWPAGAEPIAAADSIDLIEAGSIFPDEADLVREEAERYIDLCAEYQRLVELALWDVRESSQWLDSAAEGLKRFEPTVRVEFVREWLRRKLTLHGRECGNLLSDAGRVAARIDRPAPDWEAIDLEGCGHSLKEYEGRALVLCFWSRGCAWSIRAVLALNGLAAEMRGRPVAFLGVNADANERDTALVWRTLKVVFPTVMDQPGHAIARSFGADSYPTTVVVDPLGVVRRIRVGYSSRLTSLVAGELAQLIRGEKCASCD